MSELALLKSQLRSLVVSSPTAVDARTLLRDYRNLVGEALPTTRHGYRDPVQFLRERCGDCFLFQGPSTNPVLTLIVPDQLKHIDEFVQKQKMPSKKNTIKGKRRSVPETYIKPPRENLISKTFSPPVRKEPPIEKPYHNSVVYSKPEAKQPEKQLPKQPVPEEQKPESKPKQESNITTNESERLNDSEHNKQNDDENMYSRKVLQRFLQKRYGSPQLSERAPSSESLADDDSGRQTLSSSSSSKQAALERLQAELAALLLARPAGVPASQLMRLYEEQYGRELNYSRFGFASISACACALQALCATRAPDGDWLVRARSQAPAAPPACPASPAPPAPPALRLRRPPSARGSPASLQPVDPDDALPGIDYDPDVFPADCLSFVESIPSASVAGVAPGDMLALVVGEVYSPSHLWILRLGPDYDRMEDIMDEMTEYYTKGEGANRVLAAGARRPGQYCSSVYEGDWHRSLIVQLLDSDTVKVRHVDYGTVDTVAARALRPLRREWGALPAAAVRARLAGLRPPAAGRRWPRAAAQHCLRLVRDKRLVGNVVAVDHEEGILELFLIDTSTDEDVNVSDEMVRAGHADARRLPALGAPETYLFPLFSALESGATPNYAEIHALLRDGIALDYVEAYRRHVPALLPLEPREPAAPPPPPPAAAPPAPAAPAAPPPPPPAAAPPAPAAPAAPPPPPPAAAPPAPAAPAAPPPRAPPAAAPQPLLNRVPLPWASRPTLDAATPADLTSDSIDFPDEPEPASPEPAATLEPAAIPTVASEPVSVPSAISVTSESVAVTRSVPTPVTVVPITTTAVTVSSVSTSVSASAVPVSNSVSVLPVSTRAPVSSAPVSMPVPVLSVGARPVPAHPPAFYASAAYFPCCYPRAYPPQYHPSSPYAQFRPAAPPPQPPRPAPCYPPAGYFRPAPAPAPMRDVKLSASECEFFELLSLVDKNAAHRFMAEALRRAQQAPPAPPAPPALNPLAAEFRVAAGAQAPLRPPPGFEHAQPRLLQQLAHRR